jgi:hypothetical protein
VGVNPNTVDIQKMERILMMVGNLFKSTKLIKALIGVLRDLKSCVNCSHVTIFLFDPKISDHKIKDFVNMQKIMVEHRWLDRIGINEKDVSEPAFKKLEEMKIPIRN